MNLLANLSPTYRRSLVASKVAGINEAGKHNGRPISPYVEMMNALQELKQKDPTLYQRVKHETVHQMRAAARKADAALDIRRLVGRRRGGKSGYVLPQAA